MFRGWCWIAKTEFIFMQGKESICWMPTGNMQERWNSIPPGWKAWESARMERFMPSIMTTTAETVVWLSQRLILWGKRQEIYTGICPSSTGMS